MKAGQTPSDRAALRFATCRSPHTVGRDVVVAVGPNALLCF